MLAQSGARRGDLTTIVGAGAEIRGTVACPGRGLMRIEGRVEGEVVSAGHVEVAESGEVAGVIRAHDLTVSGVVRGDVHVSGRLELRATARLFGQHIRMRSLVVAEGAVFQGRCEIVRGAGDAGAAEAAEAEGAAEAAAAAAAVGAAGAADSEDAAEGAVAFGWPDPAADGDAALALNRAQAGVQKGRPSAFGLDRGEDGDAEADEGHAELEDAPLTGAAPVGHDRPAGAPRAARGARADTLRGPAAVDGRRVLWSRKRP
ncbi:MAG: polymer-forming cytoskeletal protein [Firmicutes bacterium]|nr:polymer-forming cytoskeletal protein [Bacillota bacterium]